MRAILNFIVLSMSLFGVGCSQNGDSATEPEVHPGEEIYIKYCRTCHQGGVAGSPTFGDKDAWAPRLEKGRDQMIQSTIDGIPPGMPIKGLCTSCTEEELAAAVDYMLEALTD